jgi:hypothetical protein
LGAALGSAGLGFAAAASGLSAALGSAAMTLAAAGAGEAATAFAFLLALPSASVERNSEHGTVVGLLHV